MWNDREEMRRNGKRDEDKVRGKGNSGRTEGEKMRVYIRIQ